MLILIYMPLIVLSSIVEGQLRGRPVAGITFNDPEAFALHLVRVHAAVAAFCIAFCITFIANTFIAG